MKDVAEFLAHAIKLEQDAALRFDGLADSMSSHGNLEVAAFFRKMAEFSRLHLADAKARSGFHAMPQMGPDDYCWPNGESPEMADWLAGDAMNAVIDAIEYALESEKRGQAFYQAVFDESKDPEVRVMAEEFAAEEGDHVAQLEVWRARYL